MVSGRSCGNHEMQGRGTPSSQPSCEGTNPSRHPKHLHGGHVEVPFPAPHLQDGPTSRERVLQPVPVPVSTGHTTARAQPQLPEGSSPQQPGRHRHREPPAATAHLDWDGTGNELGGHSTEGPGDPHLQPEKGSPQSCDTPEPLPRRRRGRRAPAGASLAPDAAPQPQPLTQTHPGGGEKHNVGHSHHTQEHPLASYPGHPMPWLWSG